MVIDSLFSICTGKNYNTDSANYSWKIRISNATRADFVANSRDIALILNLINY